MTTPISADVTGGIPNRSLKGYGNLIDGDCVVAARYHIEMFKNIAKGSSFKKLLWKVGFHCPTNQDAIVNYTNYLVTQDQKPGLDVGVNVATYFNWCVANGEFDAWSQVDTWSPGAEERLNAAMIRFRGVLLVGELTQNAYVNSAPNYTWTTGTGKGDVPVPSLSHAIAYDHYTPKFKEAVTWGYRQRMTPEFFTQFAQGAFVFLLTSEKDDPDFAANLAEMKSWTGVQQG